MTFVVFIFVLRKITFTEGIPITKSKVSTGLLSFGQSMVNFLTPWKDGDNKYEKQTKHYVHSLATISKR